jgi:hypothetical protein
MEDALLEVPSMRRFAGIDLIRERIPARDDDYDVPAPARTTRPWQADFCDSESLPQGPWHGHEASHNYRRHLDRGAKFHEKQETGA